MRNELLWEHLRPLAGVKTPALVAKYRARTTANGVIYRLSDADADDFMANLEMMVESFSHNPRQHRERKAK